MPSIRKVIAITAATLAIAAFTAAGCSGGATGMCHDQCNKREACGDINSVDADQCLKKCDASADVSEAALDKCINKSDILSATSECLARACSDYAKCLTALPACKTGGSSSGTLPGHTSCDSNTGGIHICYEATQGLSCAAVSGTTVSSCPTAGLLGKCTVSQGGVSISEYFYAGGSLTAAVAQSICEQASGTWSN